MTIDVADIRAAALLLDGAVLHTPVVAAPALSQAAGAELWLKLENLQVSGSFKARGALVRLSHLDEAERRRGVVAVSAGNHAQGVALHAHRLAIPATIVMPRGTPFSKVGRTEAMGARVMLEGDTLSEAHHFAETLGQRDGLTLIHPYDDPLIIAGQGTVGLELVADRPDLDAVVVPVGGGGLAAGVAIAVKALRPGLAVFGVQAEAFPAMYQALNGLAIQVGQQTLAEGIAVKTPGRLTRPILASLLERILLVGEAALERAVLALFETEKIVVEGAGAAALAAVMCHADLFAGKRVACIVSGGNIDSRIAASILLRGLARAGRMARLRIEVDDSPGALSKATGIIGAGGGNIIEIYHQRLFHDVPVKLAEVDAVIETTSTAHVGAIVGSLRAAGFSTRLLGSTAESD